ncbi:hypothetical protein WJX72_002084 [[Myrmecia] bisecta]|uniref:Transcription factor CBF/NF-Y/archaeal histone domain-containing protein n=1 Tax=[Myrmecia] bisecta TaxID=41462 RepID=A0AAW1R5J5_9CHLO
MSKPKRHPLASKIKQIMQADEEVGKIAKATPVIIARAVELFVKQLVEKSEAVAKEKGAHTLTPSHVKAYVNSEETMDFLQDTMAQFHDLADQEQAQSPKPKRSRAAGGEGSGRGRGRGRGDAEAGSASGGRGRGRGKRKANVKPEPEQPAQRPAGPAQQAGAGGAPQPAPSSAAGPTAFIGVKPPAPGLPRLAVPAAFTPSLQPAAVEEDDYDAED